MKLIQYPNKLFCLVMLTGFLSFIPLSAMEHPDLVRFRHLSLEKGISHNLTYCILQDRYGFMWFGTLFGLVKYDGRKYEVYRNDPFDSTSISQDDILSLYEDRFGNLWIGTYGGGLNRFDRQRNRFFHYTHDPSDSSSLSDDIIWSICEDHHGNLWVGTNNGLNRSAADPDGRLSFVSYFKNNQTFGLSNNFIRTLYKDRKNRLWIGSNGGGLHLYQENSDNFIRFGENWSKESNNIIGIYEDSKSILWLATWGGGLKQVVFDDTKRISKETIRISTYASNPEINSISSNKIWSVAEDVQGNLWIGTNSGLNLWTRKTGHFTHFKHDNLNSTSISSNYVSTVYKDRSGVFWIGTFRGNIDNFVPGFQKFQHFKHDPQNSKGLSHSEVSALYEDDDGTVWVGTLGGGLNKFNQKQKTFSALRHDPTDPNSISSNSVLNMIRAENGDIWIGTSNGLNRFDRKGRFKKYMYNPKIRGGMSSRMITVLLETEPGVLWMGTPNIGLDIFDSRNQTVKKIKHNDQKLNSLVNDYITCLFKESDDIIWVGTFDGLDRVTLSDTVMHFEHFLQNPADELSISNNTIHCIKQDKKKRIWIGTSNGLNLFDPVTRSFKSYGIEHGLPNTVICGILEDCDGNLWLSTQNGIAKFFTDIEQCKNFDLSHGLQSDMFNVNAALQLKCGKMMFGGINGFNVFEPAKIKMNSNIPPVYVTDFKVFDKSLVFPGAVEEIREIKLSYKQNFFTIEFAALDYHAATRNQYAYKLEGVDPDWVSNGIKNYASYTNLDPGKYQFYIRGSNNDGIWNLKGNSIDIVISPPFWLTWWFKSLGTLLFLVIISSIIYSIRYRANKKMELNKSIAELKLQALRAQMNPHFIFNTINAIQYFINYNDSKSAYSYLTLFSKLLRITLDSSEKATIPVLEELMRLRLYFELQLLRFDKKFSYKINVDKKIDQQIIEIPPTIIQPYVENAIHHGIREMPGKGHIDINLCMEDHTLECTIIDNGIGINRSLQQKQTNHSNHNSTGMRVTAERLEILNAAHRNRVFVNVSDLSDENIDENGTKVVIHIPV